MSKLAIRNMDNSKINHTVILSDKPNPTQNCNQCIWIYCFLVVLCLSWWLAFIHRHSTNYFALIFKSWFASLNSSEKWLLHKWKAVDFSIGLRYIYIVYVKLVKSRNTDITNIRNISNDIGYKMYIFFWYCCCLDLCF